MGDRAPVAVRGRIVGRLSVIAALALAIGPTPAAAQAPPGRPAGPLTVPWIMRGPEIVGREPTDIRWAPDGQWIYFRWLPPGTGWREPLRWFRVRPAAGGHPEELSRAVADSLAPLVAAGATSADRRRRVVSVDGDLFLIDLATSAIRRLTRTPSVAESDPSFDRTGERVFFRRDQNLFAFDLEPLSVTQLTDFRGPAADSAKKTGQREFVEREEKRLIEAVRDRAWADSSTRADRTAREAAWPRPVHLQAHEQVARIVPSPAGSYALVFTRTPAEARRTEVPNYVTASGYTEDLESRTKVGDRPDQRRVGLVSLATGTVSWLRPFANDSSNTFGDLYDLGWNDTGSAALLAAVRTDYTARLLARVDTGSARLTALDWIRDSAWVGGPCRRCGGWLPGDRGLWFISEADGYAHLYTMAADGSGRTQRTRGRWEVLAAEVTADRRAWALHTSEASPFERHFYLLPLDGGSARRVTRATGGHTVTLSPDGRLAADVFSTSNRPPELFVEPVDGDAPPARLTTSPTADWLAFHWIEPEIVSVPASDGIMVPARLYRPQALGARPTGAAVIFVHGAGYMHNVHRYWSDYFREYMFNHLLAQRGYVVLDVDYRGSAGYGRDWRTAIYRHMGGRDLEDQVDGARWLHQRFGVSYDRIGIYGGSYGGFITLMALFTRGQYFGAGAALRSVTDWAHYNHPYTANILNQPQEDSTAYRQSSPIYFAEGLEDPLLMAHGMIDTNVHFQDIVRLSQRLIELGKKRWELAVYPAEDHGFVRPDSWTDEYGRILDLFDRWLARR